MSGTVLSSCSLSIFWCISSISKSENLTFFIIFLTWSASPWLVVWKLAHSCQISIVFSYIIFVKGFSENSCVVQSWLSSLLSCFAFPSLVIVVPKIVIRVPEKRTANFLRMTTRFPMLAIWREPADHDTKASFLGPTLCNIVIRHFYHGWYIVAIPHPRVVYYLRTRCDREQLRWLFMNNRSQKNKFFLKLS